MKANKILIIICLIFIIILGILFIIIPSCYVKMQSIICGVFTGFIVSLIISLAGYFREKEILIDKIKSNIKCLYINTKIISLEIGKIVPTIYNAKELPERQYKNISELASANIYYFDKMELGLFSPFSKRNEMYQIYKKLLEFQTQSYNIKNLSNNLQIRVLEYQLVFLQLHNNSLVNNQELFDDKQLELDTQKNTINIKTAKFHEYITSNAMEIEKTAGLLFKYKSKHSKWKTIKDNLDLQIKSIIEGY